MVGELDERTDNGARWELAEGRDEMHVSALVREMQLGGRYGGGWMDGCRDCRERRNLVSMVLVASHRIPNTVRRHLPLPIRRAAPRRIDSQIESQVSPA
jgi:hypothetical protein